MKKISFIVIALFSLFFIVIIFYIFLKFKVKKIYVISNSQNIKGLAIINNQNLLFLDKGKIINGLMQQNSGWKSLSLDISLPETMRLTAIGRTPRAKINGHKIYYLDENGILISDPAQINDLPVIEADYIKIFNENTVDWRVLKAIDYIKLMSQNNIEIEKITIDSDISTYNLVLDSGTKVIIKQLDSPKNIVASLQTIIARFRIEGKFISVINYQFDKPVVTIANEQKNIPIEGH